MKYIYTIFATFFFLVTPLFGEICIRPELTLKEEYTDNIRFSGSAAEEDFITHINPGCDVSFESEYQTFTAHGDLNFKKYAKNETLDQTDDRFEIFSDATWTVDTAEGFQHRLTVSYEKDFDPEKEIFQSGEKYNEEGWDAYERDRLTGRYQNQWMISEKNRIRCLALYRTTDYKDDDYLDYDIYGGGIEFGWLVSDVLAIYVASGFGYGNGDYGRWMAHNNTEIKDLSGIDYVVQLGAYYSFFEGCQADIRYGVRRVEVDYGDGLHLYDEGITVTSENVSCPAGYFELRYKGEKTDVSLKIEMDMVHSGKVLFIDRKTAHFSVTRHINRGFSAGIRGTYGESTAISDYFPIDTENYSVVMHGTYSLSENARIVLSYGNANYTDHNNRNDAEQNSVFIEYQRFLEHFL